jgi:hypothetical protein
LRVKIHHRLREAILLRGCRILVGFSRRQVASRSLSIEEGEMKEGVFFILLIICLIFVIFAMTFDIANSYHNIEEDCLCQKDRIPEEVEKIIAKSVKENYGNVERIKAD